MISAKSLLYECNKRLRIAGENALADRLGGVSGL